MARFRGKFIGGILGLLAGGPVGGAFGVIVGHMYDKGPELLAAHAPSPNPWSSLIDAYAVHFTGTLQQTNFTIGVIVLGAKMAKADGRVTRAEIEAFKRVFQVTPEQEDNVGKLFNRARTSATGFEPYALQLQHTFRNNPAVLEQILGGLFIVAASDNAGLSAAEVGFLKSVAGIFGFSVEDFVRIASRAGVTLPNEETRDSGASYAPPPRNDTEASYAILGVNPSLSNDEIKAAYRKLIRENHPDTLMAQGLPPEFVATANEKMKRINVAYDTICKIRGIK